MINKSLHYKKALIEALEKSLGIVTTACKQVGISRVMFYDYYKNDPEFARQVDELENIALDFAESQLLKNIKEGKETSTIFYLKTKGKKRGYIEKNEMQHSFDGVQNISIEIIRNQNEIKNIDGRTIEESNS